MSANLNVFKIDLRTAIPGAAALIDGVVGLKARSFTVHEAISQPYEIDIELECASKDITPEIMMGEAIGVEIALNDGTQRAWNGYISAVEVVEVYAKSTIYSVRAVPKIWFLTRQTDCRVFTEKNAIQILNDVLGAIGVTFTNNASGGTAVRPICVQYRESDFSFIARLLEDEGICFYFEHTPTPIGGEPASKMILADSPSGHGTFPDGAYHAIPYGGAGSASIDSEVIAEWSEQNVVTGAKYTVGDDSFLESSPKQQKDHSGHKLLDGFGHQSVFDYPAGGHFAKKDKESAIAARAEVRLQEMEAQRCRRFGSGSARGIAAGHLFTLGAEGQKHPNDDFNAEHLVLSATHQATASESSSGAGGDPGTYDVSFEAMPTEAPFRPARTTPKPVIYGLQTAIVTDNKGDGNPDDHKGPLVKVKFFWGRASDPDPVSCWARVAHLHASNGFGAMFLPEVGDEVVISFLEGDPDRPLVIGSVYNASNKPHANLDQTKALDSTGLHTRSDNELRFDDKSGSELVYIEAKKDLTAKVKEAEKRTCKTFELTADDSITLTTGESKIVMKKDGTIEITGKDIKISGTSSIKGKATNVEFSADANLDLKASAALKAAGTQTTVEGQATLDLKSSGVLTAKGSLNNIG